MAINIPRFNPNARSYNPSLSVGGTVSPVRFRPTDRSAQREMSFSSQASERLASQMLNVAMRSMQNSDDAYYAKQVASTEENLARLETQYVNPEDYRESANAYVTGASEQMSGDYKANFLSRTTRAITASYIKKQAIHEERTRDLAMESLKASEKALLDGLGKSEGLSVEDDVLIKQDKLAELDGILNRQKELEASTLDMTDKNVVSHLDSKYAIKRQEILQEQGRVALLNYVQAQEEPFSIIMDMMEGKNLIEGFNDLTPETLRKTLNDVSVIANAKARANAEEEKLLNNRLDNLKLSLARQYNDPGVSEDTKERIKQDMLSLASSAEEYDDIFDQVQTWEKRGEEQYTTTDPSIKAAVKQLIFDNRYEDALEVVDMYHANGVSTKDRDLARSEIDKLKKGLYSSASMKLINKRLKAVAPTKINPFDVMLTGGDISDLSGNALIVVDAQEDILNKIRSGEIADETQLQQYGQIIVSQVKNAIKDEKELSQEPKDVFLKEYKGRADQFIDDFSEGKLDITEETAEKIYNNLINE